MELAHTPTQASLATDALELARTAHAGQRRKQSGDPFVEHPIAVAQLLIEAGEGSEQVVAAAYLHDVVEKSDTPLSAIASRYGDDVARLVAALTEDPELPDYDARKRALRDQVILAGRPATVIYAADRVANLRDWTALAHERREPVAVALGTTLQERMRLWHEDLAELSAADPDLPFLGAMEVELRSLGSPA